MQNFEIGEDQWRAPVAKLCYYKIYLTILLIREDFRFHIKYFTLENIDNLMKKKYFLNRYFLNHSKIITVNHTEKRQAENKILTNCNLKT